MTGMHESRQLLTILALAVGLAALGASQPARGVELDEVLAYLRLDAAAKRDLLAGQIVSKRIEEGREETELAITVAGVLPISLQEGVETVRRGDIFEVDRNVIDFGEITSWPPKPADFAGVTFSAKEAEDVTKLLEFKGGASFNLSEPEIARFRALRDQHRSGADAAAREAVAGAYREILLERYRSYREQGLAGIAPYQRGKGKQVKVRKKLELAASASKFFEKNEPELYAAFSGFPKTGLEEVEHRFYWVKQRVQDRPTLILSHRMLYQKPSQVVVTERQYYIGHSYNSVQIVNAALPLQEGIVVFYTSRTSIDQLAGFKGRVARPIAGDRLIERVTKRFETLRASGLR
jgi:hypothetical protein